MEPVHTGMFETNIKLKLIKSWSLNSIFSAISKLFYRDRSYLTQGLLE